MQTISILKIIKRILQLHLGLIGLAIVKIYLFKKYKLHLLSTWQDVEKRNKIDEILYKYVYFLWIKFEYLKEKEPQNKPSIIKPIKPIKPLQNKQSEY